MGNRNVKRLLAAALAAWALSVGLSAQAADKAGCKDPTCKELPWLARQFAYFKFDRCAIRDFDRISLDLPGGGKTIAGLVVHADYVLTDQAKNPPALVVWQNYVNALQQIGAKLVSDPDRQFQAVLTRTTPRGEFWYIYAHGSGSETSTLSYTLSTVQIGPMPQEVQAQVTDAALETHAAACKDPPWLVRQFAYFRRDRCDNQDFGALTLDFPAGKKILSGHILQTQYALSDPRRDPARFAIRDNYVDALQQIGAKLVSDPAKDGEAVLTRTTPQGEYWYIYGQTSGSDQSTRGYQLTTVQVGGPAPKSCTLEVYGVNFDFDKATLRPDSDPVLNQVLALFTGDPAYAAEIGGHTDNVGTRPYNLKLSANRAATVKAWLVAHGIAASRLTTAGYADTKPLVPNTTDENRARNRRVELKRPACKE
jgi:outer membrane protein OmpA-like peptidoglycan-associated protein